MKLSRRTIRLIAVKADVDERTVQRRLWGDASEMQSRTLESIDKALRAMKLEEHIPSDPRGQ